MVENSQGAAAEEEQPPAAPPPAPRRPGHRGMDPRETVAELTAKAHEISQSAGSKVGAAMKDVIGAAAGLTGFAVESARDLIQYMVRRGQMTQIEGDKLLREVEAAHGKSSTRSERSPAATAPAASVKPAEKKAVPEKAARPAKKAPAPEKQPAAKAPAKKPAAKSAKKPAVKGAAKTASKSTASTASTGRTKAAAKAPTTRKKK